MINLGHNVYHVGGDKLPLLIQALQNSNCDTDLNKLPLEDFYNSYAYNKQLLLQSINSLDCNYSKNSNNYKIKKFLIDMFNCYSNHNALLSFTKQIIKLKKINNNKEEPENILEWLLSNRKTKMPPVHYNDYKQILLEKEMYDDLLFVLLSNFTYQYNDALNNFFSSYEELHKNLLPLNNLTKRFSNVMLECNLQQLNLTENTNLLSNTLKKYYNTGQSPYYNRIKIISQDKEITKNIISKTFSITNTYYNLKDMVDIYNKKENISSVMKEAKRDLNNLKIIKDNYQKITHENEYLYESGNELQLMTNRFNTRTQEVNDNIKAIEEKMNNIQNRANSNMYLTNGVLGLLAYHIENLNKILHELEDFVNIITNKIIKYYNDILELKKSLIHLKTLFISSEKHLLVSFLNTLITPVEALLASIDLLICSLKSFLCLIVSLIKTITETLKGIVKFKNELMQKLNNLNIFNTTTQSIENELCINGFKLHKDTLISYNAYLSSILYTSVAKKLDGKKAKQFMDVANKKFEECLNKQANNMTNIVCLALKNTYTEIKDSVETTINNLKNISNVIECQGNNLVNTHLLEFTLNNASFNISYPKMAIKC